MMWVKYGSFSPGGNVCSVHLTRENGEKWGLECVLFSHRIIHTHLEGNLCPYLAQKLQFSWNNLITQGTPKGHHSRSKGPHGFAQKSWHSEGPARLRSRLDIMCVGKSCLIKKTCSWIGGVPWYARGENMNIFRKRNISIYIYISQSFGLYYTKLGRDMKGGSRSFAPSASSGGRGSGSEDLSAAAHSESIGGRSENWSLPLLVMAEFNVTYGWLPKIKSWFTCYGPSI